MTGRTLAWIRYTKIDADLALISSFISLLNIDQLQRPLRAALGVEQGEPPVRGEGSESISEDLIIR